MEEIVENEMAPHAGGGMLNLGVLGEEVSDIAALENENNNPRRRKYLAEKRNYGDTYQKIDVITEFKVKAVG